jgi:ABC-type oligopeptide transport system ATPase subunit
MATLSGATEPLLRVENLTVCAPGRGTRVGSRRTIVEAVSFDVGPARTLGLVGESGCGKTTLARAILRLIPPTAGRVVFEGRDVGELSSADLRTLRRRMQIVFQDPYSSLNPRLRIETIVGEAALLHGLVRTARGERDRVARLLTRVGLSPDDAKRYPHEFSGGQRQRIGIARALALEPRLIICDEPVSALDVSIQAQILNLLTDLQRDLGLAYIFIAHNLGVVRCISHEIAVMHHGRIVEHAPCDELFANPRHPYTRALLAAAPDLDVAGRRDALTTQAPCRGEAAEVSPTD